MPAGVLFNPFPGLRPFEPDEDHLFFGREKVIDQLLRRLRSGRFLSVVGTSGSGKSSLVRSGLIPSLHSGLMVKAGSSWRISILRPGEDPIGHLAASLNAPNLFGTQGELASTNRILLEATLRRGTLGLVEAVRQARIPSQDNILLIVDQFEELFRFRRNRQIENSRDEAIAFVKLLLEAAQQEHIPIYIVLTMRSDFIGDCMDYPGLSEAVNAGQYLVPRMTRDELRSAITGPIAVGGGEIAQRLVQRLLNDLGDNHDQLPVLQHALMRTWDHWERHRQPDEPIDIADYEAVGTLRQALSLHAEEAYQQTGSDHSRRIAERLFKALTDTFSDPRGVRRPTAVRELAEICETPESEVIQVVDVFRRSGRSFLMPPPSVPLDSRSIIDLSHESLMRCWTRLVGWAEEERVSAGLYLRLAQAASWFEEGTAGLWQNPQLELGLRWKKESRPTLAWAQLYDPSFSRAMEFLDRSEKERDRVEALREEERRKKLRRAWAVAGVLGIMLILAISSFLVAHRENVRADMNLQLAQNAVNQLLSSAGSEQKAREMQDLPEMGEFRKDLLEKAKAFYIIFAEQKPTNEEMHKEMAWAHFRLGDINRLLGEDHNKDAVREYQEAIQQFESLAKKHPRDAQYRQGLANSYNWLGETLRPSVNGRQDAEKAYDSALRLQQQLVQEDPQNNKYRQELARTYYNRGILHYYIGRFDGSDSDFSEAIRLLQPLAVNKEDSTPAEELARAYNDLGTLLQHNHRLTEARASYERAIGIDEALREKEPSNREYKFELAEFCENLVITLKEQLETENQSKQKKLDLIRSAERRNHQALDLIEELTTPTRSLGMALVKAHVLRGEILEAQGSREAPIESHAALDIWGKLDNTDSSQFHSESHVWYTRLAYNFRDFAKTSLESGKLSDAQNALDDLSRLLPKLLEPDKIALERSCQELREKLQLRLAKRK